MAERAIFDVEVVAKDVASDERVARLIAVAAYFAAMGFSPSYGPGDHGNLSCRTSQGLLITARETSKANLRAESFVDVIGVEDRAPRPVISCRGPRLPSTDALLHWRLYRARPEIGAILHGHDPVALAKAAALQLPITTQSALRSSLDLVEEITQLAARHDYVLMRDHGFLALGRTIDEASRLVGLWAQRARGPQAASKFPR